MNESHFSEEPQSGPVHGGPSSGGSGGFFQWIRNLGIVRDSSDRWFAGVASGIAKKANVDPIIVRGVFIVLALLGGPGLLLYLFGWLFLPDTSGKIHFEDLMRGRSTPGVTIGAIIVAMWVIAGLFFDRQFGSMLHWNIWSVLGFPDWLVGVFLWIFWITVLAVTVFVVHRLVLRHGASRRGAQPADEASFSEKAEQWGQDFSTKAEEWGKKVEEQTTEWSVEYSKRYEHTHMPRGQFLLSLAFALLAAGGAALWAMQTNQVFDVELPWEAAAPFLAAIVAATAVLAISMIIAGVRGKRTGGIGFLGFVCVVALIITTVMPWGSRYFLAGNHEVGAESPGVVSVAGQLDVDLTGFDDNPHTDESVISQVFGNIHLSLPETRPTTVTVHILAGQLVEHRVHEDDRTERTERTTLSSGLFTNRTFTYNEDAKGNPFTVTVNVGAGNVHVTPADPPQTRGNALTSTSREETR